MNRPPGAVRAVEAAAALLVGAVLLDPVGEALLYGTEGFPVTLDGYGIARLLSVPTAIALVAFGAAVAFVLPRTARGWPAAALALAAATLVYAFAPLDGRQATVVLGPPYLQAYGFAGGVLIGSVAVAVLGRWLPTAALAVGVAVPGLWAWLPWHLTLRLDWRAALGWGEVLALVAALAAAVLTVGRAPAGAPPGFVREVGLVAVVGAALVTPFATQYVDRAAGSGGQPVRVVVLVAVAVVFVAAVAGLTRWADLRAGGPAADLTLLCAAGGPLLFVTAAATQPDTSALLGLVSVVGATATLAGAALGAWRRAAPWPAVGLVAATVAAVTMLAVPAAPWPVLAAVVASGGFAFGAALVRCAPIDGVYGLVGVLLAAPLLFTLAELAGGLAWGPAGDESSRLWPFAPFALAALLGAALLAGTWHRRPRGGPTTTRTGQRGSRRQQPTTAAEAGGRSAPCATAASNLDGSGSSSA